MFLEVDENFVDHPKTRRFGLALQNAQAPWFMIRLWSWACKYAKDGDLSSCTPEEIEDTVRYTIADGKCYAAMVSCGFVDELPDGRKVIHGWMDHQGKWIAKMQVEADRLKSYRAGRRKSDSQEIKVPTPHELAEVERVQPELPTVHGAYDVRTSLPNLTKPSLTKPNEEKTQTVPTDGNGARVRRVERKAKAAPEYPEAFEAIWAGTGRIGNKLPALEAWESQGKPATEKVLEGWRHHERHDRRWPTHAPHVASWLNARGWEDRPMDRHAGSAVLTKTPADFQAEDAAEEARKRRARDLDRELAEEHRREMAR